MATLKDLAPAEKQKVARLIKQAVEREAAIRELEAALAEARAAAGPDTPAAEAKRAAALEEQNRALALENTSLRAKLTHAFDLLRTYQHKVRVLDATVAVAGAASVHPSRPVTPAGQLAAFGCSGHGEACAAATACQGVDSQLLAVRLESLEGGACSAHCNAAVLSSPAHGSATQFHAPAAACCGQLSPVAEGGAEGASPGLASSSAAAAATAAGRWSPAGGVLPAADSSLQLVQPGAPALPQLETLKMLAQALLEAQAEVVAKQQQQQQQHCGSAGTEARGGQAAAAAAGHLPTGMAVPPHAQLVFDASLGPCGGFFISQQPVAGCGSAAGQLHGGAAPPAEAHRRQAGIGSSSCGSPAGDAQRPPLAELPLEQHCGLLSSCAGDSRQCGSGAARAAGRCGSGEWSSSCSWAEGSSQRGCGSASLRPLAFGDDLLALVQDVENIGWRHAERDHGPAGARHASGHWSEQGADSGALYEENDVFLILEQL